jgi:diguanylate cyclase (GGDEF)-like protein
MSQPTDDASTPVSGQRRRSSDARYPRLSRRYGDALRAASTTAAEAVVDEALAGGVPAPEVQTAIIGPAMWWIGDLWEQGAITVADEHLATAISHQVLIRLFTRLQVAAPRSRERVLLAAVEGQRHVLGLRMVADVLEGAGFDVLYLGADVPTDSLAKIVVQHQPAVTGLSCCSVDGSPALGAAITALARPGAATRIMIGGDGVPEGLRDVGYPWLAGSIDVVRVVEQLIAGPPQPLAPEVAALVDALRGGDGLRPRPDDGGAAEARLLEVIQEVTEQTREHARTAFEYRYLAFHDVVTKMPNRRAFDDRLGEACRGPFDGMLLAIDLDGFKAVNDTHGHDAGDALLRDAGQAIEAALRSGDFAARTGGDEFAVILARCTSDEAVEIADRIRENVRQASTHKVTASVGLAPLSDNSRAVLLAADEALYAAKEAGRDRSARVRLKPSLD